MKPIYLAMTAFGPFANEQKVDFTALGENPLFLINGPTGAGKTTLLDAMTFALFGSTTGDRSGQNMRCDHASSVTETEVVFIFSYGEHTYRLERKPTQTVQAKRGSGETTRQATALLYRLTPSTESAAQNWETAELLGNKVGDVSKQVEALLGLNLDQFRQVVVLPQGRFRELLVAKAADREAVLESLFQTQRFKRIEEAVAQRAQQIKQDYSALNKELHQKLADMSQPSIEAAVCALAQQEQPLAAAKAAHAQARAVLEQAQTQYTKAEALAKRFSELAAYQAIKQSLDQQQEPMQAIQQQLKSHAQALHLQPLWQALEASTKAVHTRTALHTQALENAEHANNEAQNAQAQAQAVADFPAQIEQLNLQIPELQKQAQTVGQIQQLLTRITQNQQAVESAQKAQYTGENTLLQLKAEHSAATTALTELRARIKQHQNTEAQRQKLQSQQQQLQQLAQLAAKVTEQQHALTATQQPLAQAKKDTEHAQSQRDKLFLRWYQEQAQALAQKLQPGQACMVCGSTEHPAPAHLEAEHELVSQAQLDQAESYLNEKRNAEQKAQNAFNLAEREVKNAEIAQIEFRQSLGELAHVSSEQLQSALTELTDVERAQHADREAEASTETKITELNAQISAQEQQLTRLSAELATAQTEQARNESQLHTLDPQGELRTLSIERLQAEAQQREQQRNQLKQEFDQAQLQLKTAETKQQQAQTIATNASIELNNAKQQLSEHENAWQQALAASSFDDLDHFLAALITPHQAEQLQQQYDAYRNKVVEVNSNIRAEQEAIGAQEQPDLTQLAAATQSAASAENNAHNEWLSLDRRYNELQKSIQNYQNRAAESANLEQRYAVLGNLADTLSGTRTGRISLNRFVLSILLDDVLREASLRLAQMSQQRYELVRRTHGGDQRQQGGLDLMISDSYTGKQREVNTLSGGESFMAALALALGLSDVVQQYAGGIKINTLFIDEGFGSLDSEALDLAIDVLANLRASGRTIGIISHVSELKQRITKRIDVVRGQGGSHLR
ncbi:AAA family ATPase [Aliidiomarina celeris]|uniref:AAA family ATPase n=1 Tax=Aliidiomarina celeris TaxID=2249428 RepID=UPI000DEB7FBB|nr:SMC family ATPase [Aliidiomarina celeris]